MKATRKVVLLVDDDAGVRKYAGILLRSQGYVVLSARDGREGLELCAEHPGPIDLLLTDITMPQVGGRELAAGAVKLRPQLEVIFMSGDAWESFPAADTGPNTSFLPKPFTSAGLVQLTRERLSDKAQPRLAQ